MVKAVDALDGLQARAYELYIPGSPLHNMASPIQTKAGPDASEGTRSTEQIVEISQSTTRLHELTNKLGQRLLAPPPSAGTGEEDRRNDGGGASSRFGIIL